jgi:short-subunit dehydrogenase
MRIAVALHFVTPPETFARNAVKRMLKGRRQYINGVINRLMIFFTGIAPTSVRMMVKHKMLDKGIVKP